MEICKKAKTSETDSSRQELDNLKRYILNCRDVPQDSVAVRVCLQALADEIKRIERDEKLRLKFTAQQLTSSQEEDDSMIMNDWQDVGLSVTPLPSRDELLSTSLLSPSSPVLVGRNIPDSAAHGVLTMTDSSPLGLFLANVAISEISKAHILVSTPTAAIAVALHAVLRSQYLGFKCTGMPEADEFDAKGQSTNARKGFAAPVRELKRNQFLPELWDQYANVLDLSNKVLLRYRHDTIGAVSLRVTLENSLLSQSTIQADSFMIIRFGSTNQERKEIKIALQECFNLESFTSALRSNKDQSGVLPALHFIDLAILFTKFAQNFDLGDIRQDALDENACELQDTFEYIATSTLTNVQDTIPSFDTTTGDRKCDPVIIFSQQPRGDFADDLYTNPGLPSLLENQQDNIEGSFSGSLMGPNHPIFQRDYDPDLRSNLILPGGLGMQPRFDPFYPPAVGGHNPIPVGRGRGSGGLPGQKPFPSGDPNPDHQRPPNNLGGHMFM